MLVFLPQSLKAESYQSVVIDASGQIVEPYAVRTTPELILLQAHFFVYYVLPSTLVSFYRLTLPALPAKKAAIAVFAFLEPRLLQPLEATHFAYHYEEALKAYVIVVMDRVIFKQLLETLKAQHLTYSGIIPLVSLLRGDEALYEEGMILINSPPFMGGIAPGFEEAYQVCFKTLSCWVDPAHPVTFPEFVQTKPLDQSAESWLLKRFSETKGVNLCQGDFFRSQRGASKYRYTKWTSWMVVGWFISFLSAQGAEWYQLTQWNAQLQARLVQVVSPFFPTLTLSEDPRLQIEQALKNVSPPSPLWRFLKALGDVKHVVAYQMSALTFQENKISVQLQVKDFSQLNALETALRRGGITVHQSQLVEEKQGLQIGLELS